MPDEYALLDCQSFELRDIILYLEDRASNLRSDKGKVRCMDVLIKCIINKMMKTHCS